LKGKWNFSSDLKERKPIFDKFYTLPDTLRIIQKPDIQEDGNEQRMSSDLFNKDCSTRLNYFFLQKYISLGQSNATY
jgi:hypothetical protein